MKVIRLNRNDFFLQNVNACFYCKLKNLKKVWLFNCSEGCQHYLIKQKIKISQVSKIIITEMKICNISGLPGLLSSLSLGNNKSTVHIYGPANLAQYLELAKKYSQTNFRYNLYFHQLKTNYVIQDNQYYMYCFKHFSHFEFIIKIPEYKGKFKLNNAQKWQIEIGPLYGKLKTGYDFILPDGKTINSKNFTSQTVYGNQVIFLFNLYLSRYHQNSHLECLTIKSKI
uniref:Ribonuclease Z n=1 Tax=Gracilaria vermiculophylla TaxID=2608709 RepID=A0A345U8Q5_9FLOR|nr:ribonuclease Z [Gracilaria vermiculophylla]AXI96841.1 ribonuclease Z [Gracilaria vermiculophylla]QXU75055.1 ribonuclease Z [Gracilaria vermiculophylla]WDZ67947.1 ribonuclease Z [Gracilaria vermiculophylla]